MANFNPGLKPGTNSGAMVSPIIDKRLDEYYNIVSKNEDLKSEERILNVMIDNLRRMKELMVEKEKSFCDEDERIRKLTDIKESLRQRCAGLINHLIHFKCIIECLATDILSMGSNVIDDDEYISLSLTYRNAETLMLQGIKTNQQRSEVFATLQDELVLNCLLDIELKWRLEHEEKRKQMTRLLQDQYNFVIEKTKNNLNKQQILLNFRYSFITSLVKLH